MAFLRSAAHYTFNSPCRSELTFRQKALRSIGVSLLVFAGCVIGAFLLALAICALQALLSRG
jgi:hypothetical protein